MKKNIDSLTQKTIAIFIPSSPVDLAVLSENLRLARSEMPYAQLVETFSHAQAELPFLFSQDRRQAEVFNRLLTGGSYDFIWMARGGYGSSRWLSLVDWDRVSRSLASSLVVGFSDVTFLHSALVSVGQKSLHAPMLTSLSRIDEISRAAVFDFFRHGTLPNLCGEMLFPGIASGQVIGGNLTCLVHSIGTAFEPPWDNAILLLEDHNEAPYRIDRCLTHLLESGRLRRLAGIAVGEITGPGLTNELLKTILEDRFKSLAVPVIFGIPVGHGVRNMPVLLGETYTLDADAGCLIMKFTVKNH